MKILSLQQAQRYRLQKHKAQPRHIKTRVAQRTKNPDTVAHHYTRYAPNEDMQVHPHQSIVQLTPEVSSKVTI